MNRKITRWKIITGTAATLLGVYMLYGTLTIMPDADREWMNNSVQTIGTVTQLRETFRNRASCCYVDISFKDTEGNERSFSPYDCFSCGSFSAGRTVRVRYRRGNPETAIIDSEAHQKATYIAVYVLAGILCIIGTGLAVSGVKGKEI